MAKQYRQYTGLSCKRLYIILYDRYTRHSGYQMFGFDWATLYATRPDFARRMRECLDCDKEKK
jgi:hypothetical protein